MVTGRLEIGVPQITPTSSTQQQTSCQKINRRDTGSSPSPRAGRTLAGRSRAVTLLPAARNQAPGEAAGSRAEAAEVQEEPRTLCDARVEKYWGKVAACPKDTGRGSHQPKQGDLSTKIIKDSPSVLPDVQMWHLQTQLSTGRKDHFFLSLFPKQCSLMTIYNYLHCVRSYKESRDDLNCTT